MTKAITAISSGLFVITVLVISYALGAINVVMGDNEWPI